MTTTMERGKCNIEDCRCCAFEATEEDPKMCECGHKRVFHLVPRTEQTRRSLEGARSVSAMVSPVFEKEVNMHLHHNLPSCLPLCRISDIRNRQVECDRDGETLLEIDSFGYVFEDECSYGRELKTSGIFLIEPQGCGQKKSASSKQKLSKSPGEIARKLDKQAEKYIIGESYSGQSEETVEEKVKTLEARVKKMQKRYSENHAQTADDVTCAVGAVVLCFSAGPKERDRAKSYFDKIICAAMSIQATPLLWRMAAARRLFLVVLSDTENPQATAFREIAAQGESTQLQLDELQNQIQFEFCSLKEMLIGGEGSVTKSKQSRGRSSKKASKTRPKSEIPCRFGDHCRKRNDGSCRYLHSSE